MCLSVPLLVLVVCVAFQVRLAKKTYQVKTNTLGKHALQLIRTLWCRGSRETARTPPSSLEPLCVRALCCSWHLPNQAAMAEEGGMPAPAEEAMDAAKVGDQHRIRLYLDRFGGNVNLRDRETQGTLLHVSKYCCYTHSSGSLAQNVSHIACYIPPVLHL